jgi:hypothetical protein
MALRQESGAYVRLSLVLLSVLATLAVAPFAGASGAEIARSESVPACAPKLYAGMYPHPDCVFRPFKSVDGGAVTGTLKIGRLTKVNKGRGYELTVVVTHKSVLTNICTPPSTPLTEIPCHNPGVSVGLEGKYVPKATTLGSTSIIAEDSPDSACPDKGPCTRHFGINPTQDYGRLLLVFQVAQGELTKNPANDIGSGGFEVVLAVNIPQLKNA